MALTTRPNGLRQRPTASAWVMCGLTLRAAVIELTLAFQACC